MPVFVNVPSFNIGKDDLTADNVTFDDKQSQQIISVQQELEILQQAVIASGAKIYYGTCDYWASQPTLISERGSFYVYSDYYYDDNQPIPGVKIGDGSAYVVSLPFTDKRMVEHITDSSIHLSEQDRLKLENSVCAEMSSVDTENLILFK